MRGWSRFHCTATLLTLPVIMKIVVRRAAHFLEVVFDVGVLGSAVVEVFGTTERDRLVIECGVDGLCVLDEKAGHE